MTRTLRIDVDLERAIAKRAASEKVSFNFLAGRCLRRFVEWDAPATELGLVMEPKLLINEAFSNKSGEDLENLGRRVAREFLKPGTEYIMGDFSAANAIEVLRRASIYGKRFGFDLTDGHDSRSFVMILRHDQGAAWSRYFFGILDEAFRALLHQSIRITYTDALCVAQLDLHDGGTGALSP